MGRQFEHVTPARILLECFLLVHWIQNWFYHFLHEATHYKPNLRNFEEKKIVHATGLVFLFEFWPHSSFPLNRSFWHRCQNCIREKNSVKNLPLTGFEPLTLGLTVLLTSCLSCLTPVLDPIAWKKNWDFNDPYVAMLFWFQLNPLSSSKSKNQ